MVRIKYLPWSLTALVAITLCLAGEVLAEIETIPGYYAFEYATGLTLPTSLSFGSDSTLYVTGMDSKLKALRDTDHDGTVDSITDMFSGFSVALGVAATDSAVYVTSRGQITAVRDTNGDYTADVVDTLVTGIPWGHHSTNGLVFGSDGLMYVGVGSIGETGVQPEQSASIVRYTPQGDFVDVYATGLRNPYDLVFAGDSGLLATDNSPTGDSTFTCYQAFDEINFIKPGEHYGFPDCFGVGDCDTTNCYAPQCGNGDCERNSGCTGTEPPYMLLQAHSAPTGICSADGLDGFGSADFFFAQYGQDVPTPGCLVNMGGRVMSFNIGAPPLTASASEFAWGFGSVTDVTVGPDGALYVADFAAGVVYRIIRVYGGDVPETAPRPELTLIPNPARAATRLVLGAGSHQAEVFDVNGRHIAGLNGQGDLRWNLTDDRGVRVASGVYWVRVRGSGRTSTAKLLVVD